MLKVIVFPFGAIEFESRYHIQIEPVKSRRRGKAGEGRPARVARRVLAVARARLEGRRFSYQP
jgi:hypothetical protein